MPRTAALERLVAAGLRLSVRLHAQEIADSLRSRARAPYAPGHLPHRPARQARARVAAARAGRRRRDRHVRRSLAAHAITEPRDRSRRFRAEARGRPMGLPARGRRRRCRCAHHASCAALTCSTRPLARSTCSTASACRHRNTCTCPSSSMRTARAQQADGRDRARSATIRCRHCGPRPRLGLAPEGTLAGTTLDAFYAAATAAWARRFGPQAG